MLTLETIHGASKGVIGQYGDANLNNKRRLVLQKCTAHYEHFQHRFAQIGLLL